jgi:hypothetical protein
MVEWTNDELGSVWKESVVVEFEALSEHFPRGLISRPINESGVCLIRCFSQRSWDIIVAITVFLSVLFNDARRGVCTVHCVRLYPHTVHSTHASQVTMCSHYTDNVLYELYVSTLNQVCNFS